MQGTLSCDGVVNTPMWIQPLHAWLSIKLLSI